MAELVYTLEEAAAPGQMPMWSARVRRAGEPTSEYDSCHAHSECATQASEAGMDGLAGVWHALLLSWLQVTSPPLCHPKRFLQIHSRVRILPLFIHRYASDMLNKSFSLPLSVAFMYQRDVHALPPGKG